MKRRSPVEHISEGQHDPRVAAELTRNLRGQADKSLLQWIGRNKMLAEQERVLTEAILNTPGAELPRSALTKPGDPKQLRGIPAIGGRGSLGGAIAGTQPLAALLAREKQRERRGD